MSSDHFYRNLPPCSSFLDLVDPQWYRTVPADWWVAMTDIAGSTAAIAAGRYKDVNLIGACSIIAVLNVVGELDIPFVFGGDGATLLIPPNVFTPVRLALLGVRQLAAQQFDLDLRVGLMPIADLPAPTVVKVAKYQLSPHNAQASFIGGGLTEAMALLKGNSIYQLHEPAPWPDLTGLHCRWQDILSPHGQTITFMVMALPSSGKPNGVIYQDIMAAVQHHYGIDYHPVTRQNLRLSFNPRQFRAEWRSRGYTLAQHPNAIVRWFQFWGYGLKMLLENCLGWLLMTYKLTLDGVNWGTYPAVTVAATDYRKIDDLLRMVIVGNAAQTQGFCEYLERQWQQGTLAYGVQISDRALMTCLIFNPHHHLHFVDGADGGYAVAAEDLKQRLDRQAQNWPNDDRLMPHHPEPETP